MFNILSKSKITVAIEAIFNGDLHAKRVESLANATLGIMTSKSLIISRIGQGLAEAEGSTPKHAIKQVDRLLSNDGICIEDCFEYWVPHVIGPRKTVIVAMDWTDFDKDGQTTLAIHLTTSHGRSTPLLWITVDKSELKDNRNNYEDALLSKLHDVLPDDMDKVTVLADRGFSDCKLMAFICEQLGFEYVIRIKKNINVVSEDGEKRSAGDWLGKGGRVKTLHNAKITCQGYEVPTVVCVQDKDMKEPWCIVSSDKSIRSSRIIISYYGKRWGIEPSFRDIKDLHFGMGLKYSRISIPMRRDRILLLAAIAIFLLTLLGAAGESLGLDRLLKSNTLKRRTHSLFRQGCMFYNLLPNAPKERRQSILRKFNELIKGGYASEETLGYV